MTGTLNRYLYKISQLSAYWWRMLGLLALGVVLKSLVIVMWDAGASAMLINSHQLFAMGGDFVYGSLLLALTGGLIWKLDRRKGYGSLKVVGLSVVVCALLLLGMDYTDSILFPHLIFITKYALWMALTTVFWAVSKKFITNQLTSLRFLSLFCLDLVGFCAAGLIIVATGISPIGALIFALMALIAFFIVIKTIADLANIPKETFTMRADGIQDVFEKPLVTGILSLSFFGVLARILTESLLYYKLSQTGIMPMTVLGLVWLLFGALGLFIVMVLYHTRYIYTTLAGMMVYAVSVMATGVASLGGHSGPMATGYLVSLLGAHFYLNGYLQILPRILSGGIGPRLKKRMMTVVSPLAFVLCGSLLLNFSVEINAWVLTGVGVLLILITLQTAHFYATVLFHLLEMRLWRNGPIMISFPRLVKYIKLLLKKDKAQDVIYALRILEIGNHSFYETALKEALKHPMAEVRCFALQKMRKLYRMELLKSVYHHTFQQDDDIGVKNEALTNLILSDKKADKYVGYLSDKKYQCGAIAGFLSLGDNYTLPATKSLEKMLSSSKSNEQIQGLKLIQRYPSPAFVPDTERLIKSSDMDVAKEGIITAGYLQDPQLLNFIFRALDDTNLQESALRALRRFGRAVFPAIEKMILRDKTPTLRRKLLVLFLSVLPSGEAKQILIRALSVDNQKLRKNIIQSLLESGIVWIRDEKKQFLKLCLKKDLDRISYLIHLQELFSNAPSHESEEACAFFLRAIQEDITDTRQIILYQLLLLDSRPIFTRAVRILQGDSYDLYLPALGVIQDLLPGRLYRPLRPVLLLPLAHRKKETLEGLSVHEAAKVLSDVITQSPFHLNHWIRATALYGLRRLGSERGISAAEYALSDAHPVVFEAAVWTLVRLQEDKEELHRQLLTIPTSRLTQVALDELLES